jgi:glycosyltransferase involved in cell wall biosynthesis
MSTPRVSVVMPAWNCAWCIDRALDSLHAQTFTDFEAIVVDDGSTDDTPALLARRGEALRVIRQSNAGMSAARNAGIAAARGELVAFLDSDDWWRPEKLAQQVALMDADPDLGFCSSATELQSEDGTVVGEWGCPASTDDLVARILGGHAAVAGGASSVMVRRSVLHATDGFDARLRGAEDTDLWVRLAAVAPYACIPDRQVVVTRNAGSVSRNREAMRRGALDCLDKNRPLLPASKQDAYWRACRASVLADYAKWRYRDGDRPAALQDLFHALKLAPMSHGRLVASLALAMLTGRAV